MPCRCGSPQAAGHVGDDRFCGNCGKTIDEGSTCPMTVWINKKRGRNFTCFLAIDGRVMVRLGQRDATANRVAGVGFGASVGEACSSALNDAMVRAAS